MAKTRRAYTGAAVSTTTASSIAASGTTSFTITAYTGWPYGTDPFYIVVEPGTASEEKILVTRTGSTDTTINIASDSVRGLDGTSAVAHNTGSTVFPVFTAVDADEANELASKWTTKGDLVSHGASTFERLGVGTNDYVLTAASGETSGLKWAQVGTAGIANGAVTAAKLGAGTVLQVVQGSTNTGVTNTTSTYVDTGVTATITPLSTSSKILVLVYHGGIYKAASAPSGLSLRLLRGATQLFYDYGQLYNNVAEVATGNWSATYLDSPNTTSATTYKTQFHNIFNGNGVQVQVSLGAGFNYGFIQLVEIAG